MGVTLLVALAVVFAAHAGLVATLARRRAWVRAAVALVVAPLAPWWGWRDGGRQARALAVTWVAAVAVYAVVRAFA